MNPSTEVIKINPEYYKLVNPLSSLEYQSLKTSIEEKGMYLPIIINQDNVLLDGHNRYQICQELGIEPRFETKIFEDELEEKEFVIEINLKRRQLNNFQKIELGYELKLKAISLIILIMIFNFIPYSIPDEIKTLFFFIIIAHLFGLYKFSKDKIKSSITPEVIDIHCPKCQFQMFSTILKCNNCGTTVNLSD